MNNYISHPTFSIGPLFPADIKALQELSITPRADLELKVSKLSPQCKTNLLIKMNILLDKRIIYEGGLIKEAAQQIVKEALQQQNPEQTDNTLPGLIPDAQEHL